MLVTLYLTGTTLNVQSLMGVVMMVGMVVSNSILIVEFTHRLRADGMRVLDAVALVPHPAAADPDDVAGDGDRADPDGDEAGHRQRSLRAAGARDHRRHDGLADVTIFIVPAAYLVVYRRKETI